MPCLEFAPNAYICTTGVREILRRIRHCPTCKRRRRFVIVEGWSAWYAPTLTCLGCGDSWSEGWRMERPFRRGWRQEAIAQAKAQWANAHRQTDEERRAWLRSSLGLDDGGDDA